MNRRLRSPRKASSSKIDERFHRFLKPGALARIRDSRCGSRTAKDLLSLLQIPPSPPSAAGGDAAVVPVDGTPCFAGRIYGPRFPQRRRLAASRSVFFVPTSPGGAEDLIGADLLLAH
ncbi:hypothetical protein QJS10_CPB11g01346 [Acorus calamus]|uniref:Uncharacterized protein n=1 Tax=Acorus calamus TaxID=4465 RepID=A0AAV9DU31_ACOCL|nr:hypothetical protein QJS10_CPB11g01346 [Acorus calamus]